MIVKNFLHCYWILYMNKWIQQSVQKIVKLLRLQPLPTLLIQLRIQMGKWCPQSLPLVIPIVIRIYWKCMIAYHHQNVQIVLMLLWQVHQEVKIYLI